MAALVPTSRLNSSSSARFSAVRLAKLRISHGGLESLHGTPRGFNQFAHVLRISEISSVVQRSCQAVLAGSESLEQTPVGVFGGVFHPLDGVLQGLSVAEGL